MTTLKVKITTTEEMLGTSPADRDIYQTYIAARAQQAGPAAAERAAEEVDAIQELSLDEQMEKGLTVFGRDNGKPICWDYQWRGMFKDACGMLRRVPGTESSKCKAFKKVIDGLIFVDERKIPIETDQDITWCQRPLRAQTPQGDRVALAVSEAIAPGATMTFTIRCYVDSDVKMVKEWLDYGKVRGFGQWRNSGKGTFTWELLEEKKVVA